MRKKILSVLFAMSVMLAYAEESLSSVKGVWASDNAEAVITDAVCIYYAKADSTMQAVLEIPSASVFHKTVFEKDGSVTSAAMHEPLEIRMEGEDVIICGERLEKVEDIVMTEPYDMPECRGNADVGRCLQEWRLGVKCSVQEGMPYCEVNTNRHMFIYMVSPSMVYIRAAATRNNDGGTLFFQNIRMMKNQNTGEYTMSIVPDNLEFTRKDLMIDDAKFNPTVCTFSPDGGIYWSLISFEPDTILLNGCGETYHVDRMTKEYSPLVQWIEYRPY